MSDWPITRANIHKYVGIDANGVRHSVVRSAAVAGATFMMFRCSGQIYPRPTEGVPNCVQCASLAVFYVHGIRGTMAQLHKPCSRCGHRMLFHDEQGCTEAAGDASRGDASPGDIYCDCDYARAL